MGVKSTDSGVQPALPRTIAVTPKTELAEDLSHQLAASPDKAENLQSQADAAGVGPEFRKAAADFLATHLNAALDPATANPGDAAKALKATVALHLENQVAEGLDARDPQSACKQLAQRLAQAFPAGAPTDAAFQKAARDLGLDARALTQRPSAQLTAQRYASDFSQASPSPAASHPAPPQTASAPTFHYNPLAKTLAPDHPIGAAPTKPAPDAAQAAADRHAKRVAEAVQVTAGVWAKQPADTQQVALDGSAGPEVMAQKLEGALARSVGTGNWGAYNDFMANNRGTLSEMGSVLSRQSIPHPDPYHGGDRSQLTANKYLDQLHAPLMVALARQNPGAQFRLLALKDGTLPARMVSGQGYDSQLAIEMVSPNGQTQQFILNPAPLNNASGLRDSISFSGNTEAWYAAVKSNGLPAAADRGNAKDTLQFLADQGNSHFMMAGLVKMKVDDQRRVFEDFGRRSHLENDPKRPLGALAIRSDVVSSGGFTSKDVIASADASSLLAATPPKTISTATNVNVVPGLDKEFNFVNQNFGKVISGEIAKYTELKGDAPRKLTPVQLGNELGMAMHLTPDNVPQTPADWAALDQGNWPLYRPEGDAGKTFAGMQKKILEVAGVPPRQTASITTMPVFFNSKETGLVQLPLVRVTDPQGRQRFVDNTSQNKEGRVYDSIEDFQNNNKLPPGELRFPSTGHLGDLYFSHDNKGGFWDKATGWLDKAAFVGGIVVGAGIVIGSGGTALLVAGGALAAYGVAREGGQLVDRSTHGQTLNPFQSTEARNEWVGLGVNALGFAALGTKALATAFKEIPELMTLAGRVGLASDVANVGGLGTNVYDLAKNWDKLSPQDRLFTAGQIMFWGGITAKGIHERVTESFGSAPKGAAKGLPEAVAAELESLQAKIPRATTPQDRIALQAEAAALLKKSLPELTGPRAAELVKTFNDAGVEFKGLENSVLQAHGDSLLIVDGAGKLAQLSVTPATAKAALDSVKASDLALGNRGNSYQLREEILRRSGNKLSTLDAFTYKPVDAQGHPITDRAQLWAWQAEPAHWLPERLAVQQKIYDGGLAKAEALSHALTQSGEPNTLYALRGNTAAGKSTTLRSSDKFAAIRNNLDGAINPDTYKYQLRGADRAGGKYETSWSQTHEEGSVIARRIEEQLMKQPGSSLVYDKRFSGADEIPALLQKAQATGKTVRLVDVDTPLELSLARDLTRTPSGDAPLVPFDPVAQGFMGIRANRLEIIEGRAPSVDPLTGHTVPGFKGVKDNPAVKSYDLFVTDSTGKAVLVARKENGVWHGPATEEQKRLYAQATNPDTHATVDHLRAQVIDEAFIDRMVKLAPPGRESQFRSDLEAYKGLTLEKALEKHSALLNDPAKH